MSPDAGGTTEAITRIAETYYDSDPADRFYSRIWGGEDIHIGIREDATETIAQAGRRTIERMAAFLPPLDASTQVLDMGAGYGGSGRYLAKRYGCRVVCLNLSNVQNRTNERLNREQGLDHLVSVVHGSFQSVPEPDERFDVVWSQDAILHAADRVEVLREAYRVLKPGGCLVFTDPMQSDDCPDGVLQPVYDRIHLNSLGSFKFYRETATSLGFTPAGSEVLTPHLRDHYAQVREELLSRYDEMVGVAGQEYVDRMLTGLENWVKAADAGYLAWGILMFRK